jgi:hypothetical protein
MSQNSLAVGNPACLAKYGNVVANNMFPVSSVGVNPVA